MGRYKAYGQGWHNDNYKHSLAAKGMVVAEPRKKMFRNYFAPAISDSWKYMFGASGAKITENPINESIRGSASDWFGLKISKEKVVGGVADDISDKRFEDSQLSQGVEVEMEHTVDPNIAKEIAKDHLAETGKFDGRKFESDYYDKLKLVEGEGQ